MHQEGRVWSSRRSPWLRLVAALLVAALSLSFAPRPAAAAAHRCHAPAPQHVVTTADDGCGQCTQGTCLAMPGCGHVVALALIQASESYPSPSLTLSEPETPIVRGLAPRGPPTPPPNS